MLNPDTSTVHPCYAFLKLVKLKPESLGAACGGALFFISAPLLWTQKMLVLAAAHMRDIVLDVMLDGLDHAVEVLTANPQKNRVREVVLGDVGELGPLELPKSQRKAVHLLRTAHVLLTLAASGAERGLPVHLSIHAVSRAMRDLKALYNSKTTCRCSPVEILFISSLCSLAHVDSRRVARPFFLVVEPSATVPYAGFTSNFSPLS